MDPGTILAVIQLSAKVLELAKFYIETAREASSDLRSILVKTSTVNAIFTSLDFLSSHPTGSSSQLTQLSEPGGIVHRCREILCELESLLPADPDQGGSQDAKKTIKDRARRCRDALAWPLKASRAEKLLNDLDGCINKLLLVFAAESS